MEALHSNSLKGMNTQELQAIGAYTLAFHPNRADSQPVEPDTDIIVSEFSYLEDSESIAADDDILPVFEYH